MYANIADKELQLMEIIRELDSFKTTDAPVYLALGNFDGVHKGHQQLINKLVEKARLNEGTAAAFIFEPHPIQVLNPAQAPDLINTAAIKAQLLQQLGIDVLIYHSFTPQIAQCSPRQFVEEYLLARLGVQEVFIGFNYSFGYKGAGTPELLEAYGTEYGFAVNIIAPVEVEGVTVSSTFIRKMLSEGNIAKARTLLGYYPILEGIIIKEEGRGAAIGFPTANLRVEKGIQMPAQGVYAAFASLDGEIHKAVVNIGTKPTFHEEYPLSVEAHIIDFNKNIYGQTLRLYLVKNIRKERKFSGIDELVKQIAQDKAEAYQILLKSGDGFTI
jgi:riboflavin kinase/FMN adenylyltransferase